MGNFFAVGKVSDNGFRVCTPHCRAQKIKRFHTVQGLVRGAAAYGSSSLSGFCAVYIVFAFVLKIP